MILFLCHIKTTHVGFLNVTIKQKIYIIIIKYDLQDGSYIIMAIRVAGPAISTRFHNTSFHNRRSRHVIVIVVAVFSHTTTANRFVSLTGITYNIM